MKDFEKLSDEELINIIRKKDKEYFSIIIDRYEDKLLRYVFYLISNHPDSQDIVQNTFIKAYVNLNSFNTKKKFSSWIYRIAHNEAMNIVKKFTKEKPLEKEFDYDSGISLEDDLIKKELKSQAHNCLKKLDIIYREPLSLYFLEEKSYEEISDILRVPIGTVGTRINRAKVYMKKICQKIKK